MSRWRVALLLLALVATSAQQLVVQTHWHATVQVDAGLESPAPAAPGTGHDDCVLCQIAAHAGALAPPASLLPSALVAEFHPVPDALDRNPVAILQPAHDWQSRGPPTA